MSRERTGSIDVTTEGRFRVRVTLPNGSRPTVGIYDTEDEADIQRRATLELLKDETVTDGWTLGAWIDRILTAREIGKTVRDPDSDWSRYHNHIEKDPIAKMPLRGLRRRHVREWLKRVRSKVARQTALNVLNIVRVALGQAFEDEIIKANVAKDLRLPKEKRTEEPWTYLTPREQHRLILVGHAHERWLIAFAIGSGLRAGELCTLRLADLHTDDRDPHVVVRYGTVPNLSTKGGAIRHVPLFGLALTAAREWLALLPSWARENPHKLVFPRLRGGFRDEDHVLRWDIWKDMLTAAEIKRPFRFHDLRHTAASSLISGWWGRAWSLEEIQAFLGHASITTTERYAHLAGTALQRAGAETRNGILVAMRPCAHKEETAMIPGGATFRPRTGDLRFTNATLNPEAAPGCNVDPRMVAVCRAYLIEAERGNDAGAAALAAQMGAVYFSDPTRAIDFAARVLEQAHAAGTLDVLPPAHVSNRGGAT